MPDPNSDPEVEAIRAAIFAGRKIEAIKLYREYTGLGLKQSKDFVETLEEELRRVAPERFTAPMAGKGCAGAIFLFLILLSVVATV